MGHGRWAMGDGRSGDHRCTSHPSQSASPIAHSPSRGPGMPDPSIDFLKGTLDLMILKTLSWAPTHGYGIARWIEQCTDDTLAVEEGSLYPALHRLEERGLIAAEWGVTELNRKAKFYRLTTAGKKQLRTSQAYWSRFAGAVTKVLETAPSPT